MYLCRMSDMRWSGPQIALFMSLYKTHRALWDPTCPDYCRREERDRALASMLAELKQLGMPTSMEALKKRMKSYRDTYRNELARIVRSIGKGKLHNPKLGWFTIADSFLRNIILGRSEAERLEKLMGSAPIPLMEHGEQLVHLPSPSEEEGSPERDPLAPDPVPEKEVAIKTEPPDSPQPACVNSEPPSSPQSSSVNSEPLDSPRSAGINSEPPGLSKSACVNSDPPDSPKSTRVNSKPPDSPPSICIKTEPPDSPLQTGIKSEPEEELEFHRVQENRPECPPPKRLKPTPKDPLTPSAVRTLKSMETPLTSPLDEPLNIVHVKRKRGRPPKGTFGPIRIPPVEKQKVIERPPLNPLLKTYRPSPRLKPLMPAPSKSPESTTSNNELPPSSNTLINSNNLITSLSNTLISTQSNTLITTPSNTLMTAPSNTLINAPSNTLIPTPSNTLISSTSNTLIPTTSNTLISSPSNSLMPTPQNSTHVLLFHRPVETTLNPAQVKLLTPAQMSFLNPGPVNLLKPTTTNCQNFLEEKCPNPLPGKCLNPPTKNHLNTASDKSLKPKLPQKPEKPIKAESSRRELEAGARMDFLEFGQHVAAQLGQLPLEKALLLQSRIQSLITKERLACISRTQPTRPLSSEHDE